MRSNRLNEIQNKVMGLKVCPACGSENLVHVDSDTICGTCPWNSAVMSVEAGELDDLIYEYEELSAKANKPMIPLPMRQRIRPEILPSESIPKFKKQMESAS
jgi:hypothetical protein